jgi:hypothetical protein
MKKISKIETAYIICTIVIWINVKILYSSPSVGVSACMLMYAFIDGVLYTFWPSWDEADNFTLDCFHIIMYIVISMYIHT